MPKQEYYDGSNWVTVTNGTVTSITAGTGLDGGTITDTGTLSLADTAVTAGSYTYLSATINDQGQITAASSGAAPISSISGTNNEIDVNNGNVISLASTIEAPGNLKVTNGYLVIPSGTTAERPSNPTIGTIRINTDL